MKAEVVAIGNEVLSGSVVNTNAAFISQELRKIGIEVTRHAVYPDERIPLSEGLQESLRRSPLVIASGGLGPTCDDNTRQVAAEIFESGFHYDETLAAALTARYGQGLLSIEDQATVPTRAFLLNNRIGTAPGFVFQSDKGMLILVPGVPSEMEPMMVEQVLPFLRNRYPALQQRVMRGVYLWGVREAEVDPLLRQLKEKYPELDFGIYPKEGQVSIHVYSDGNISLIESVGGQIEAAFPDRWYSSAHPKIEEAVYTLLKEKGLTVSTAESFTGGTIASTLVSVPGASDIFLGSLVTYSYEMKQLWLKVSSQTLAQYGAVSEPVVKEMLHGLLQQTGSDWGIATTGIAGPTGAVSNKPIGTVYLAVGSSKGEPYVWSGKLTGTRDFIIRHTTHRALGELYRLLKLN